MFADKFSIMTQKHPSDLFATEWKTAMNTAVLRRAGAALALEDIHSKVWEPAFCNCQSLLQELHDHSMKLTRVDNIMWFWRYNDGLEMQLVNLFAGVNACLGDSKKEGWIRGVVHRIRDYWHLDKYRKTASVFLELKKSLKLQKGDFSDVQKLATQVRSNRRLNDDWLMHKLFNI